MNFTGIDFAALMPDNSFAYIAFDLEYGFRLLEERRDLNAVYFRDLADPDTDGISNTAVTNQGLIIKSSLVAYNGSLGPLEDRVGELIKIGDTWATVLLYNSDRSVVVDNYPTKLPPIQSIQNNLINIPLHGLTNNTEIQFSGATPPIGITEGTTYYVRNPTTNSFNISSGPDNLPTPPPIIPLVDRAGELYVSRLYSVFVPTLNYDVIKDTIIGKVIRTGNFYTVETFYNVSGESITSFEIVEVLPTLGAYEGQVVLFQNTFYTWNGVSWVTASGTSSRTVSLGTSKQAFTYNSNGALVVTDPVQSATITATAFGTTGTLTYEFRRDGTLLSGTGNTRTYTPNPSFDAMPDIVTVDLFEDGLLVASDLITMFGVVEGSSAITIVLSNEAHTIPTDSAGNNPNITGSSTSIQVFRGNTALSYVSGSSPSSFDITGIANSGVSGPTTRPTTAVIPDITGISAPTGSRDITITVYSTNSSGAVVSQTFNKIQSFSRSVAGVNGLNGAAAAIFSIDNSAVTFIRGVNGVVEPSAGVTLTTSSTNFTGIAYQWQKNGTNIGGATLSTYTVPIGDYLSVVTNTYTCNATGTINGTAGQLRSDSITIPRLDAGSSSPTVVLSNENITFAAPTTGFPTVLTSGICNITAFIGTTSLTYDDTVPYAANSFRATVGTPSGIAVSSSSAGSTFTVTPTSISADSAFVDITVIITDAAGAALSSIVKRITYSLSRAGATGGPGATGAQARIAYAIGTSNFAFTGTQSVSRSGDTLPIATDWNLPAGTSWSATPTNPTTNGTSLYQVTGLFDGTNTTWYGYPYLSALKVGSLSAISADLGTITAGTITSGAPGSTRLVITPGLIEVYEGAQLRVRLGVWT